MSKRFGRNQKRRLREQVQTLQLQLGNDRYSRDHQSRTQQLQRKALDRVSALLGRHFVALDAPTLPGQFDPGHTLRLPSYRPAQPLWLADYDHAAATFNQILELEAVATEAELDKLRDMVHCRVKTPIGTQVAYVEARTLHHMGRQYAAQWLAEEIARQLVKELPV